MQTALTAASDAWIRKNPKWSGSPLIPGTAKDFRILQCRYGTAFTGTYLKAAGRTMYSSTENKDRAGIKLSDQLGSIFVCWLCGDASIWEQSRNVAEEQKGMPQLSDVPCITGGIVYACDPDSGNNDFSARTIRKELSMEKLVLFDGEI